LTRIVRSQKISPEYLPEINSALKRNSYPSQQSLASDVGLSLSTVKSFLKGKPIDYLNFVEICEKLGLDWQEVSAKETLPQDTNPPIKETSPFITKIGYFS